jgi:hypothetical protein
VALQRNDRNADLDRGSDVRRDQAVACEPTQRPPEGCSDARQIPVPMDVYLMSAATKEDINKFYAESESTAALPNPVWHSRSTVKGTSSAVIRLAFDDLGVLLEKPVEILWEIEGHKIGIPFNILLLSGETEEEMRQQLFSIQPLFSKNNLSLMLRSAEANG